MTLNRQVLGSLIRKDLKLFSSDRRAMLITILVPVGIASFFGMLMGGKGGGPDHPANRTAVMVVDQDRSPVSREILANLRKDNSLEVKLASADAARDSVLRGKTTVALVLPPEFGSHSSRAMFSGEKPVVKLLYDPSHNVEMQMLRGLLTQQVMEVVSKSAFSPESAPRNFDQQITDLRASPNIDPQQKGALTDLFHSLKAYYRRSGSSTSPGGSNRQAAAGGSLRMSCDIKAEAVTASHDAAEWSGAAHAFCGMAVQGLLFWAIDAGIGILRERQKGLWKRLRAAPLSRGLLLAGKMGSSTLISLLTLVIVFAWGALFFHLRIQGSIPGFLVVCVATALMAATFGLLIASLGRTESQSRGYALPAVLAMSALGGAWLPASMMPHWIQTVSLAIPSRWAVDGFDAMTWRGLGIDSAIQSAAVLLAFAAAFWLIALARFRWEADG